MKKNKLKQSISILLLSLFSLFYSNLSYAAACGDWMLNANQYFYCEGGSCYKFENGVYAGGAVCSPTADMSLGNNYSCPDGWDSDSSCPVTGPDFEDQTLYPDKQSCIDVGGIWNPTDQDCYDPQWIDSCSNDTDTNCFTDDGDYKPTLPAECEGAEPDHLCYWDNKGDAWDVFPLCEDGDYSTACYDHENGKVCSLAGCEDVPYDPADDPHVIIPSAPPPPDATNDPISVPKPIEDETYPWNDPNYVETNDDGTNSWDDPLSPTRRDKFCSDNPTSTYCQGTNTPGTESAEDEQFCKDNPNHSTCEFEQIPYIPPSGGGGTGGTGGGGTGGTSPSDGGSGGGTTSSDPIPNGGGSTPSPDPVTDAPITEPDNTEVPDVPDDTTDSDSILQSIKDVLDAIKDALDKLIDNLFSKIYGNPFDTHGSHVQSVLQAGQNQLDLLTNQQGNELSSFFGLGFSPFNQFISSFSVSGGSCPTLIFSQGITNKYEYDELKSFCRLWDQEGGRAFLGWFFYSITLITIGFIFYKPIRVT